MADIRLLKKYLMKQAKTQPKPKTSIVGGDPVKNRAFPLPAHGADTLQDLMYQEVLESSLGRALHESAVPVMRGKYGFTTTQGKPIEMKDGMVLRMLGPNGRTIFYLVHLTSKGLGGKEVMLEEIKINKGDVEGDKNFPRPI